MPVPGEELPTTESTEGKRFPHLPHPLHPNKGSENKGTKGRYRLLAGVHIGDDGEVHTKGNIVESHINLTNRFGDEKFQELSAPVKAEDDDSEEDTEDVNQRSIQATTTLPGGERITGPAQHIKSRIDTAREGEEVERVKSTASSTTKVVQPVVPGTSQVGKVGTSTPPTPSNFPTTPTNPNPTPQGKLTPKQVQDKHKKDAKAGKQDDYDDYSAEELKKVAEEEEIDLKGAKTKEEMLKVIRAS